MEFYTIKEFAERLGISQPTVRRYIKSGELTAYEIGDGWKIPAEEINNFLEHKKVKSEKEND